MYGWYGLYPTSLSYLITVFNFLHFQFLAHYLARDETNSPKRGRAGGPDERAGVGGGNDNSPRFARFAGFAGPCELRRVKNVNA